MRNVPAYENAVKDSFERCLDLYLCPRVRKKRVSDKSRFEKFTYASRFCFDLFCKNFLFLYSSRLR